jgi:hypothetical protein
LEFLPVYPDPSGDANDLGRNPSIENTHREAVIEQPPLHPITAKSPTVDPGARGDAHKNRSNSPFKTASDGSVLVEKQITLKIKLLAFHRTDILYLR